MKQIYKVILSFVIILFFIFSEVFAGGGVMWQENGVLVCDSTRRSAMASASDGKGGVIVGWIDDRNYYSIYAQRMDRDGNMLWTTNGVPVCYDGTLNLVDPHISCVSDGGGGAIFTWVDLPVIDSLYEKVYVQRIDSIGVVHWGVNGIRVAYADNPQQYPSIVSDGAGGCIVAWLDYRNGNTDIYAQRVDSSGLRLWGAGGVEVSSEPGIYGWFPSISSDGEKGTIIAWSDKRYGDYDCFAQRIDSVGILQWGVNGIEVYVGDSAQYAPQIIKDLLVSNNKRIISWTDGMETGISMHRRLM